MCIADEVQTALGRTGEKFWAFQNHGNTFSYSFSFVNCIAKSFQILSWALQMLVNLVNRKKSSMYSNIFTVKILMLSNCQQIYTQHYKKNILTFIPKITNGMPQSN